MLSMSEFLNLCNRTCTVTWISILLKRISSAAALFFKKTNPKHIDTKNASEQLDTGERINRDQQHLRTD